MDINCVAAQSDLAMLLRDQPRATTADLTDAFVVYWDGDQLAGAFLSADEPGSLEGPADVDEILEQIPENLADWFASPSYTWRPELLDWLMDAPPIDSGV